MADLIDREAAYEVLSDYYHHRTEFQHTALRDALSRVPSAQQKTGEWEMFELITSVYYGKQYYFKQENGIVYSRASHKYMPVDDAIREFLDAIGE